MTSVAAGSNADSAGFRPGMVISSIENTSVISAQSLPTELTRRSQKSRVLLLVQIPRTDSVVSRFISVSLNDSAERRKVHTESGSSVAACLIS